jgi:hypothetical protein
MKERSLTFESGKTLYLVEVMKTVVMAIEMGK